MNLDPDNLVKSFGYLGVWTIVFAETGILFGVFLPGDSLLIAAGMLAAHGHFDIGLMTLGCFIAAMIGNLFGYEAGRRWGKPFLDKYGPKLAAPEKIEKTYEILRRHERIGIVIARFFPGARTFAPFLGGVIRMKYAAFVFYSLIGAVLWGGGLPLVGYYFGSILPKSVLDLLIIPVVFFILLTVAWPWLRRKFKKPS